MRSQIGSECELEYFNTWSLNQQFAFYSLCVTGTPVCVSVMFKCQVCLYRIIRMPEEKAIYLCVHMQKKDKILLSFITGDKFGKHWLYYSIQ